MSTSSGAIFLHGELIKDLVQARQMGRPGRKEEKPESRPGGTPVRRKAGADTHRSKSSGCLIELRTVQAGRA